MRLPVLRGRATVAYALMTTLAAVACGTDDRPASGDGPAARATSGDPILRVAYNREIDVLNPYTSQNLVDIQFSMVEGLVTTDANNNYVPVLAREIPTEAIERDLPEAGRPERITVLCGC